jgi:hypothetical protein
MVINSDFEIGYLLITFAACTTDTDGHWRYRGAGLAIGACVRLPPGQQPSGHFDNHGLPVSNRCPTGVSLRCTTTSTAPR